MTCNQYYSTSVYLEQSSFGVALRTEVRNSSGLRAEGPCPEEEIFVMSWRFYIKDFNNINECAEPCFEYMYQSSQCSQLLLGMTSPSSGSRNVPLEQRVESPHTNERLNYSLQSSHIRKVPHGRLMSKKSGGLLCMSIMPKFSIIFVGSDT
jgi:hypothetical protein